MMEFRESTAAKDRTSACKAFEALQGEEKPGAEGDSMTLILVARLRTLCGD